MVLRGLLLISALLSASMPLFANRGPTPWIPDRAICDSSDRRSYVWEGAAVPFGAQSAAVDLNVADQVTITDVDVLLNINHTYDGDVRVFLRSPTGMEVVLISQTGGSEDNFTDTYLNDDADQALWNGQAPYTGSFRPYEVLAGFNEASGTGVWTLRLEDTFPSADNGSLIGWTLILGGVQGGIVYGTVSSIATSLPVEGAVVRTTESTYSTITDSAGRYRLVIPLGFWDLDISYPGWCSQSVSNVEIVGQDSICYNVSMRQPIFHPMSSSLNYQITAGRTDSSYLVLQNTGNCDLYYHIASSASWIRVLPDTGQISSGTSELVWVTFSAQDLSAGEYSTAITIVHTAERSPSRIPIFLWVLPDASVPGTQAELPRVSELAGIYPNPFNIETTFQYNLSRRDYVTLDLYSIDGRLVDHLLNQYCDPGYHRLPYHGSNLASGTYLLKMSTPEFTDTKKVILLK